ncbi:hypothetical protein BH11PSE10_BH11PSE10_07260 [soil metagenome]
MSGKDSVSRDAAIPEVVKWAALADPLAESPDLLQVFQRYRDSEDPRLKAAAQRAFSACTPAFLPGPGETPSPELLIAALPSTQRMAREEALRALYARCQSFMGLGRDALLKLRGSLATDGGWREAGQHVDEELAAGNVDQARRWATGALRSGDPAAITSIAGPLELLLETLASAKAGADVTASRAAAADMAAALPLLACDLGMDCSNRSLAALQLCAAEGQCEGDAEARFLARAAVDPGRAPAVQAQRRRLLDLYRQGRPPSADDLLP